MKLVGGSGSVGSVWRIRLLGPWVYVRYVETNALADTTTGSKSYGHQSHLRAQHKKIGRVVVGTCDPICGSASVES